MKRRTIAIVIAVIVSILLGVASAALINRAPTPTAPVIDRPLYADAPSSTLWRYSAGPKHPL